MKTMWELKLQFMNDIQKELDAKRTEYHIKDSIDIFETVEGFNFEGHGQSVMVTFTSIKEDNGLVLVYPVYSHSIGIKIVSHRKTFCDEMVGAGKVIEMAANQFRSVMFIGDHHAYAH